MGGWYVRFFGLRGINWSDLVKDEGINLHHIQERVIRMSKASREKKKKKSDGGSNRDAESIP
jgi:hypothetical protein